MKLHTQNLKKGWVTLLFNDDNLIELERAVLLRFFFCVHSCPRELITTHSESYFILTHEIGGFVAAAALVRRTGHPVAGLFDV